MEANVPQNSKPIHFQTFFYVNTKHSYLNVNKNTKDKDWWLQLPSDFIENNKALTIFIFKNYQ